MRDATFALARAAAGALAPFAYRHVVEAGAGSWRIRAADGAEVGWAKTRAGARAAVRRLYEVRQDAEAAAAMRSAA